MSRRARSNPSQQNTLAKLLSQVPLSDCKVLMTDLNEQLPPNVKNVTGKWAHGEVSKNADDMIEVLRMYDLFAVNTAFQPKRSASNTTFIKTEADHTRSHDDLGLFHGRRVSTKYHGNWDGTKRWMLVFDDDFTLRCGDKWIRDHLKALPSERKRISKQIDYTFVSNRWRSSVTDSKVKWGPSIHRNVYGKDDHGSRTRHVCLELEIEIGKSQGW